VCSDVGVPLPLLLLLLLLLLLHLLTCSRTSRSCGPESAASRDGGGDGVSEIRIRCWSSASGLVCHLSADTSPSVAWEPLVSRFDSQRIFE